MFTEILPFCHRLYFWGQSEEKWLQKTPVPYPEKRALPAFQCFFFQVNFWKEPRLAFLGKLFIHLPTLKLKVTAYMKSVTYNNEFDFSLIFKGQPLIFLIEDIWNSLLTAPWGKICVVLLGEHRTKQSCTQCPLLLMYTELWSIRSLNASCFLL